MKRTTIIIFVLSFLAAFLLPQQAKAQFREEAFTQTYNDKADSLATADTSDSLINFREIFGGLAHKHDMRIGTMFGTSLFIPGASQIFNGDYWKLPIFYSGIAAGLTTGTIYHFKYQQSGSQQDKNIRLWSFIGAGCFYYASLMDGVACYKPGKIPNPGRATVYSILCPGLGQAYNKEYWKIPIYVGGLVASYHFFSVNNTNYIRFRNIYREASEPGYSGPVSAQQAKYYRDEYRRYRDYSVLALAAVYLLQIIDANVFCYMNDFEVNDNLALQVSPTVIMPENDFAMNTRPAAGFSVGFTF